MKVWYSVGWLISLPFPVLQGHNYKLENTSACQKTDCATIRPQVKSHLSSPDFKSEKKIKEITFPLQLRQNNRLGYCEHRSQKIPNSKSHSTSPSTPVP